MWQNSFRDVIARATNLRVCMVVFSEEPCVGLRGRNHGTRFRSVSQTLRRLLGALREA